MLGPLGPLFEFFRDDLGSSKKSQKKIPESTDQYFRSVVTFFKRPKLYKNEAEPNSKKYGESLWFFLYIPVGERGTLTMWSFEKKRVKNFRSEKIIWVPKSKIWMRFWGFDQNFEILGKILPKKIPKNTDRYFRSVFIFFKGAKLPQNRVTPASNKYGWITWFFLYRYSIGLR